MIQMLKRLAGKALQPFFPKPLDEGARYIIKLEDADEFESWYLEWSTYTRAPLCRGMPKSKFRNWYLAKYPRYDMMRLEKRLDDVDCYGSDKPGGKSADDIIEDNKAGSNWYPLSKEEILAKYCPSMLELDSATEEFQRVSYFKERPLFLHTVTQELKSLFPVLKGVAVDVESEIFAKNLLQLVDDDQAAVEIEHDTVTNLWVCRIVSKRKGKKASGESFDHNRNVAICVATANWKTALEKRDADD